MNWHNGHRYNVEPTCALYLITAPAVVVSKAEMKRHLRVEVDNTDDDTDIEAYTAAATAHLEGPNGYLSRALNDQTWELRMSWFPCGGLIRIPLPPLIEVVSIKYFDEDDAEQTFDTAKYHVTGVGDRGQVHLGRDETWPTLSTNLPEPAIIQFRAGYLDSSESPPVANVPAPIVSAIKLFTADLYENRGTIVIGQTAIQLPWAAEALARPYRIFD